MDETKAAFGRLVTAIFKPILSPIFTPINNLLNSIDPAPWGTIGALALFFGGMIFVFSLRKEYVNLDAPGKGPLYDLRIWTVLSMTPHVIMYLYFAKWSN